MYVATVPNRNSPPAILLRESYREGKQVKTRTLANLSDWPPAQIEALRRVLRGETLQPAAARLTITRSLPHGHVAAVLGVAESSGLSRLLPRAAGRMHKLALALIVARVIAPASKLATARGLCDATAGDSLGAVLGLGEVDEDELYATLDWLVESQAAIETKLARAHLRAGTLVLFDVSSSYLEGRHCELGRFGYNRDGKRGKLQIVYGLLCNRAGCPIAVEVFAGDTADPETLSAQISKLKVRFGIEHVVLVGDRGMLTQARIEQDVKPAGLDWITALRAPAIRVLAEGGALQLSLFDERDLAEITHPDYPSERLIVCRNPLLAEERARKREDLLAATERRLQSVVEATQRKRAPLRGGAAIALKVGALLDKYHMAKHFVLHIEDEGFRYVRDLEAIAAEARLDGFYVLRTSVAQKQFDATEVVAAYKSLASVERAFRSLKTLDLHVRPLYHRRAARVRAHVFVCMLAYYLEWHMRQALAPLLFDDDDPAGAKAQRRSLVAPAQRSPKAQHKATSKRTADDLPVHSFQTLLADLATLARNTVVFDQHPQTPSTMLTEPTPLQQRAFELLGVKLRV